MKIPKSIGYIDLITQVIAYTGMTALALFMFLLFIGKIIPLEKHEAINKAIDIPFSENK